MSTESSLPRAAPETQGISSAALLAFVEAAEREIQYLHSFMLLRHGAVIGEGWWAPYAPDLPHVLFSLSKSFASTAVGLAVAEGRLTVDDPVVGFFPDEAPAEISANLAAMRVRHLLSMATGHSEDTTGPMTDYAGGNWIKGFLAQPVGHAPGAPFVYNSGATYMLSAIVQKVTGQRLVDYLKPRLFDPLGITGATWEMSPQGIDVGGWGLNIKTEDIARFGQLYLQQGVWQGKQIVPREWVAAATAAQVDNSGRGENPDWEQGYGYQFWRCRHNAYRGDGAFGQYCIVLPDQDAVLAITSGVPDMQAVLDLVWTRLLPAFGSAPLPEDAAAHAALQAKLAELTLPLVVAGAPSSPAAQQVSGHMYAFPPNDQQIESVTCTFGADADEIVVRAAQGEHRLMAGHGAWRFGETALDNWRGTRRPVATSGAWTAPDTYTLRLLFYTTPFHPTLTLRFVRDQVLFDFEANVSFEPAQRPQLVGEAITVGV
jgi:CubicO group peptidase (beta-lactamase class C family)